MVGLSHLASLMRKYIYIYIIIYIIYIYIIYIYMCVVCVRTTHRFIAPLYRSACQRWEEQRLQAQRCGEAPSDEEVVPLVHVLVDAASYDHLECAFSTSCSKRQQA